jgi:GNAT superfamily N-acetyltransferase
MFPKSSSSWTRWATAAVHPSKLPPKFTAGPSTGFHARRVTISAAPPRLSLTGIPLPDLAFGISPVDFDAITSVTTPLKAAALPDLLQRIGIVSGPPDSTQLGEVPAASPLKPDPKTTPWLRGEFVNAATADLGNLREGHARILMSLVEAEARHAPHGTTPFDIEKATVEQLNEFLTKTVRAPAQRLLMIKRLLIELAQYEATGDPSVANLVYELNFCHQVADVAATAAAYFGKGPDGFLTFFRGTPREDIDAALKGLRDAFKAELAASQELLHKHLEQIKKAPNHAPFLKASGLDVAVFDNITRGLLERGLIFEAIYSNPADLQWGVNWFGHLGKRLKDCTGDQGVACTLYFKDTYLPGPISHVAMAAFNIHGEVLISHQETIPYGKPGMVEGITLATAGVPTDSFNTTDLHNVIQGRDAKTLCKPEDCPIFHSYKNSGPPLAQFTMLNSFSKAKSFVERATAQSRTALGKKWLYGVDPSQPLGELVGAVRAGKIPVNDALLERFRQDLRFGKHAALPPPGAVDDFVPGMYVNNCGFLTVLTLLAGECVSMSTARFHSDMDLREVAQILFASGLAPNTDPEMIRWMIDAGVHVNPKTGVPERHPGAFLILGSRYGWGNATPGTMGTYPAHVERNPAHDKAQEFKDREDAKTKALERVASNRKTFLSLIKPGAPIEPAEPWVARVLTAEDWPPVEAFISALSDDDCDMRWGHKSVAYALQVEKEHFPGSPGHKPTEMHMGLFDPTGKTLAVYGSVSFMTSYRAEPALVVHPKYRHKGCAKQAMRWVMAFLRNRGFSQLWTYYYRKNESTHQLLSSLGLRELAGDSEKPGEQHVYDPTSVTEIFTLPAPDVASVSYEEKHRKLSAAWPAPKH